MYLVSVEVSVSLLTVCICVCVMCTRVCPCGECVCVFVNSHWLLLWEFITPKVPYPSTCVNCRSGTSLIKVLAFDRFLFGFAISCSDKFLASEIHQHLSLLPWLRTISARFWLFVNRLRLFLWFFYVFLFRSTEAADLATLTNRRRWRWLETTLLLPNFFSASSTDDVMMIPRSTSGG